MCTRLAPKRTLYAVVALNAVSCHVFAMEAVHSNSRVWSTVGNQDAFAHWREVVCQAFTRLSPERLDENPFAGEIRLSKFGEEGTFSRITAGAQIVQRGRRDVETSPCDAVFVNIQISGTSVVRQREIEAKLVPGTFVMLDARQPFDMRFDGNFQQICMHLPMELLRAHQFDPSIAIARTVSRNQVYGAALLDSVQAVLEGVGTETSNEHLVQLLQLSFAGGRSDALADRHLKHIRHFVAHNCSDSDMSPRTVAERFRISTRHLHKLFSRSGTTFGQFLLQSRLRKSRLSLLLEPEKTILDISLACGFQSSSHFSRAFQQAFGLSPSALRRQGRSS